MFRVNQSVRSLNNLLKKHKNPQAFKEHPISTDEFVPCQNFFLVTDKQEIRVETY